MSLKIANGLLSLNRVNPSTHAINAVLVDVRGNIQPAKEAEAVAVLATGPAGGDEIASQTIYKAYIGGYDENPTPSNWYVQPGDIISFTGTRSPRSMLTGTYRVIAQPEQQEGNGLDYVKVMLVRLKSTPTVSGSLPPDVEPVIADKHYTHTQNSAATVWLVNHNLGKYPSVRCEDSTGADITGMVTDLSLNALTITFNSAVAGYAYLN